MTVGRELSAITGIPLFHNHLSIEAVLPVFEYGSPPFDRLVTQFRDSMFAEYLRVDNTDLSPRATAEQVASYFNLV